VLDWHLSVVQFVVLRMGRLGFVLQASPLLVIDRDVASRCLQISIHALLPMKLACLASAPFRPGSLLYDLGVLFASRVSSA